MKTCSVRFVELEVLGVVDGLVHLADCRNEQIVMLSRSSWIELQNKYLDLKAEYFNRYNHYCGAEHITYDPEEAGSTNILSDDVVYKNLVFAKNIDIEMEHG